MSARLSLDDFLPYLVNRVGSAMVASFAREALDAAGLTIAMWRVLAALSHNGAQRQIDLAAMTSIDASTLSRLVTRLIRRGLVVRTRSTRSNREVAVRLSPKGATLVRRLVPIATRLQAEASAGLSDKELAALRKALRRIHANLSGLPLDPPPGAADSGARNKLRSRHSR